MRAVFLPPEGAEVNREQVAQRALPECWGAEPSGAAAGARAVGGPLARGPMPSAEGGLSRAASRLGEGRGATAREGREALEKGVEVSGEKGLLGAGSRWHLGQRARR